ncbi:DUF3263 domain-containing protein [Flaviflexus ciconiae]|nr:DUF3263 domain-containing protein [Flaviflexus ciconiae]
MTELNALEEQVLVFEETWDHSLAKPEAIRRQFGWSSFRYHLVLNRLLDSPAAILHHPVLVARLRSLRDSRQAERK